MKISFKGSIDKILAEMHAQLKARGWDDMVTVESEADTVTVKISKLGTSRIVFAVNTKSGTSEFTIKSENIAFTHRPFRRKVDDLLESIVAKFGGNVS